MSLVYCESISSYCPLTMSDTSLRGFYTLGKNEISVLFNKAFVCCMIELILWFSKEHGEKKIGLLLNFQKTIEMK